MKRILLALLCLGLAATAAHADEKFDAMDTNKDGSVSWEEFHAAYPQMQKAAFESIDADKSGSISHEEWDMFMMHHQMGKMSQGGGMGGGMGTPPAAGGTGHDAPAPLITPPAKPAQ